jgi:predicted lipoprotein with Yx(FWY)xxD motif
MQLSRSTTEGDNDMNTNSTRGASAAGWARYLGAAALLAVGVDHIQQYYAAYYRSVPTIGPLFLANFVAALVVSLGLVLPVRRIAGRRTDQVRLILAAAGIAIAAGSIAALLISENAGLFGFMERGYRGAIVLALSLEGAAVLLLAAFIFLVAGGGRLGRRRLVGGVIGASSLLMLVLAGCGGASGASGGTASSAAGRGTALQVVSNPRLGKIIVDSRGRTLYDFRIDKGTMSVCYGGCASLWPPLTTTGAPVAGRGVKAALIGTTKRKDGSTEVTYAGHPLYYFAPDRTRGQISGQALDQFGAPWYALAPGGREIHTRPH